MCGKNIRNPIILKNKRPTMKIVVLYLITLMVVDIFLLHVFGAKDVLPTEAQKIEIKDPNITFHPNEYYDLSRDGRYIEYYCNMFCYLYSLSNTESPLWIIDVYELEKVSEGKLFLSGEFLDEETFVYILTSRPLSLSYMKDAEVWVINRTQMSKERIFNWSATYPSENYRCSVNLYRGYDNKRFFFVAYYEWWSADEGRTVSKIFNVYELDAGVGLVKSARIELNGTLAEKAYLQDIDTRGGRALLLTDTEIYTASLSTGEIKCVRRIEKGTNTILNGLYRVNYHHASFGPDGKTILLEVWKGMVGQYGGDSYNYFILDEGKRLYPIYLHEEDESVRSFISRDGKRIFFLKSSYFFIVNFDRDRAESFVILVRILEAAIFVGTATPFGYYLWSVLKKTDCLKAKNLNCYIMLLLFSLLLFLIMANYIFGGTSRVGGVLLITIPFIWTYLRYNHNVDVRITALFFILFFWQSFFLILFLRASAVGCLGGI